MAKRDWPALAVRYQKEAKVTGVTVKDFCKLHGLPISTARRYIKPLDSPSNADTGTAQMSGGTQFEYTGQNLGLSDAPPTQNQQFITLKSLGSEDQDSENDTQYQVRNPKKARNGNQNNLKHGYYSEFITTNVDADRYANALNAELTDELNLCRIQLAKLMKVINQLQEDLDGEFSDPKDKIPFYEQLSNATSKMDGKVARIESLEVSIVRNAKAMADIEKSNVQTAKSKLEIKIMSKATLGKTTPLTKIYQDILTMSDNGMMTGGHEESLNIPIDAEYSVVDDEDSAGNE